MTFDFDNDADWEMMWLHEQASKYQALRKRGICSHTWTGPVAEIGGIRKCYNCGRSDLPADHIPGDTRYTSKMEKTVE